MGIKKIAILGSTGSIGRSALKVIEAHPDRFEVVSLAAARSVELLAEQARRLRPKLLAVLNAEAAEGLTRRLDSEMASRVVHGPAGYLAAASGCEPDMLLSAMVGAAGLVPTFAALKAGIDVALANKETLVAGGSLVMAAAAESGAAILPVDSEHSAVFQSLAGNHADQVKRIWLTASGGPFRKLSAEELAQVTPEMALAHPNWSMGPKITVDSATLMNKGLEAIEARWLFDQPLDRIKIVIHPQSIVHSMVEYIDGSLIAQMGVPDMAGPIAYALGHPRRIETGVEPLNPATMGTLSFEEPDFERFPALGLAYSAGQTGGDMPAVLNAANEVAVEAFLAGRLGFGGITDCVAGVMDEHTVSEPGSIAAVLEADLWARGRARAWLTQHTG